MNEWLYAMRARWSKLTENEKKYVLIGSTILSILIFYFLIWNPALSHIDEMRSQITTDQKVLNLMRQADHEINQLELQHNGNHKILSPVELLSLLQKEVDQANLAMNLTQLKQSSSDGINMSFQKIEFDQLIVLLTKLVKQNVVILQFSATANETPGLVNADIIVSA